MVRIAKYSTSKKPKRAITGEKPVRGWRINNTKSRGASGTKSA
jgi:hypothetical protein